MLTGVSPPPLRLLQNAIPPEQVIRHHHSELKGGNGGQALFSLSLYMGTLFQSLKKGILLSPCSIDC